MQQQTRNLLAAAVAGVLVGAFTTAVLMYYREPGPAAATMAADITRPVPGLEPDDVVAVLDAEGPVPSARRETAAPSRAAAIDDSVPTLSAGRGDTLADLRERQLLVPVQGFERSNIAQTFEDPRSGGRRHQAIDILAPRNTPVLAVEDGTIARMFMSKAGGITLYQYDPDQQYVYYYAHLERYADGLEEGGRLHRGQVIGYVGTTGNAPPDTPHLHFAIFETTEPKRWWEGRAIDPFLVLR